MLSTVNLKSNTMTITNNLSKLSLSKPEIKSWLWILMTLCLTYSFLLCNLIWGNHDWSPMLIGNSVNSGLIEGRFAQYILPNVLVMGQILPFINLALGLMAYALALTLLLTRFFNFSPTFTNILILCTISILPYIIEILYFQFIVLSQLFWPLLISITLLVAKKSITTHPYILTTLSTILLFTTLGGYPAAINLYLTATILYLLQKTTSKISFKSLCRNALPFILSLFIASIALYVTHKWLQQKHIMMNLYNNQPASIKDIIFKIPFIYKATVLSLLQPQPFFSLSLKLIMAIIILLFFIHNITQPCQKLSRLIRLGLWLVLPLCLKFSAWLINENPEEYFAQHDPVIYMLRADFYAIPILLLFGLISLAQSPHKSLKNICLVLTLFLFWTNVTTNYEFSKIQKLGFTAENLLQQRINNRITTHPAFNFKNNYTLVQAGELPLRPQYYTPKAYEKYGYYTLQIPNTRHWIPNEFYAFYEPENFILSEHSVSPESITKEMSYFLNYTLSVWPSPNALYIDDNYIILALSSNGKTMLTQQFKNLGITQP